jgi:hypothetical protein
MRDPIDKYLEDVLCQADLARDDEHSVRAELKEHLETLMTSATVSNPKEIYTMLKDEFGNPKKVGRAIAHARGYLRTFFKKQRRTLPWKVGIAAVLLLAIRYSVAESFYVPGDGLSPEIPRGSRVLVYKLSHSFAPGDVIVYRHSQNQNWLGRIVRESNSGGWVVERNAGADRVVAEIADSQIIGRVFLNTR